jgi:predicted dithiol-disulfide oxidoreductase (DUF899 family)
MALETINGTLQLTRLTNESAEYVARREELRLAEIELMRQGERVAAMRRRLPSGTLVQDYVFQQGPANLDAGDAPITTVRLSDLFTGPNRSVVIYHLMYGKRQTSPCPMCTMWIDGYNGVRHHLAQNVDFAIAAAADLTDRSTTCSISRPRDAVSGTRSWPTQTGHADRDQR